jgi:hypothetical protein
MAYAQTLSIPTPSSARPASGRRRYARHEPAPTALIPRSWKNFTGAGTSSTLRSRRKMLRRQRYSMPQMFPLKQPAVCCRSMEGCAKHSRAKLSRMKWLVCPSSSLLCFCNTALSYHKSTSYFLTQVPSLALSYFGFTTVL